jgi:hypothetical protein
MEARQMDLSEKKYEQETKIRFSLGKMGLMLYIIRNVNIQYRI